MKPQNVLAKHDSKKTFLLECPKTKGMLLKIRLQNVGPKAVLQVLYVAGVTYYVVMIILDKHEAPKNILAFHDVEYSHCILYGLFYMVTDVWEENVTPH